MLVAIMVFVAFFAGCILIFFITEFRRNMVRKQIAELEDEREELLDEKSRMKEEIRQEFLRIEKYRERVDEYRENVNEEKLGLKAISAQIEEQQFKLDRYIAAQKLELDRSIEAHATRKQVLADQIRDFEQRVISYFDLEKENRVLKSDLKNMLVYKAQVDALNHVLNQEARTSRERRDQIARDYFADALANMKKSITTSNYPLTKKRLTQLIASLEALGVKISKQEQESAFAELQTQYQKVVRAELEREAQAQLREQMREEQRLERERQKALEEAAQAEREKQLIEQALQEKLKDVSGQHAAEIEQLKIQLAEAEARSQRAISNAQIQIHGHVYVISNRGSFGPDVFKIGMTRRNDPLDRVYELGDASVPFPFDVHMMIKCDDAPKLEKELHRQFSKRRVNKVNLRKEYFRVGFDEILKAVEELHGTVEYTADAEALEFMESQNVTDEELRENERVFEQVEAAVEDATGVSLDEE